MQDIKTIPVETMNTELTVKNRESLLLLHSTATKNILSQL